MISCACQLMETNVDGQQTAMSKNMTSQAIDRCESILESLNRTNESIRTTADRVLGALPRDEAENQPNPPPATGSMQHLGMLLERIAARAAEIQSEAGRLHSI